MTMIEEAITEHWGERCDECDADCIVCRVWRELDVLRAKVEAADRLAEAVLLAGIALDQGRMVSTGAGGMTIEANIRASVYNGVPAWPMEELRDAITAYKDAGE